MRLILPRRLRPQHRDHVWRYDFVFSRTHDGRPIRMLTMIDELTRECLAIDVSRRLTSEDVAAYADLGVDRIIIQPGRSVSTSDELLAFVEANAPHNW